MFAVRYVALAMLALWVGGLVFAIDGGLSEQMLRRLDILSYASGAAILLSLFVMKFVGPPPAAFAIRAGLVGLMVVVTALAGRSSGSATGSTINAALGLVLLCWYARE